MSNVLECKASGEGAVTVGDKTYRLTFPLWAVAEAEAVIGRQLRSLSDWFVISPKELEAVIKAGLRKHHPEESAQVAMDICDTIGPEVFNTAVYGLCQQTFPESLRRIEEATKKGDASPNVPSGEGS